MSRLLRIFQNFSPFGITAFTEFAVFQGVRGSLLQLHTLRLATAAKSAIADFRPKMNIFLIGYRCTGKTTVGRSLANRLDRLFFDTDLELVKKQGVNISDIVNQKGWAAFREIEKRVIQCACERDNQVVATGGGAVLDEENVKRMKDSGVLVWLRADIKTIEKRIIKDNATRDFRPALTSKGSVEEIRETLFVRNPYYEKAMDFYVDTDSLDIEAVCDRIIQKIKGSDYKSIF